MEAGGAAEADEADGGVLALEPGGTWASGGVLALEGGVICWSGSILEGGITEELTEWDVLKIYTEGNFLEKSVLPGDRFQLIAEIAAIGQWDIDSEDVMQQT